MSQLLSYPTPHIKASPEDFAKTVLMPGDPLRAKFIAENYLTDAVCINDVRGMLGYTGYYKNTRISVFASGMGMPSMGIYSYELFNVFGVERIIRIGSAGALQSDMKLYDVVLAAGTCTNSAYANKYDLDGSFAPIADFELLRTAARIAAKRPRPVHVGNVLTSDHFYVEDKEQTLKWAKMGVLAVEMESAALYMNAAQAKKAALAMFTISDSLVTGESTSAEERQTSFTDMIEIALDTAVELAD